MNFLFLLNPKLLGLGWGFFLWKWLCFVLLVKELNMLWEAGEGWMVEQGRAWKRLWEDYSKSKYRILVHWGFSEFSPALHLGLGALLRKRCPLSPSLPFKLLFFHIKVCSWLPFLALLWARRLPNQQLQILKSLQLEVPPWTHRDPHSRFSARTPLPIALSKDKGRVALQKDQPTSKSFAPPIISWMFTFAWLEEPQGRAGDVE